MGVYRANGVHDDGRPVERTNGELYALYRRRGAQPSTAPTCLKALGATSRYPTGKRQKRTVGIAQSGHAPAGQRPLPTRSGLSEGLLSGSYCANALISVLQSKERLFATTTLLGIPPRTQDEETQTKNHHKSNQNNSDGFL